MSQRVSQMEALKDLLDTGEGFTMSELVDGIADRTGKVPSKGSLNVLLSHLRTKFNYSISLTRGDGDSVYKLAGTVGRKKRRK